MSKDSDSFYKDVKVVETEYKPSFCERVYDFYLDYCPNWIYRINHFFVELFNPYNWYRHLRWFVQRRIRGFDDRITWNLDGEILNWLYPRLKRFSEITAAYPDRCGSFKNWEKELKGKVHQLYLISTYEDLDFPKEEIKKWLTKEDKEYCKKWGTATESTKAYYNCYHDFMDWLAKNIGHLWW